MAFVRLYRETWLKQAHPGGILWFDHCLVALFCGEFDRIARVPCLVDYPVPLVIDVITARLAIKTIPVTDAEYDRSVNLRSTGMSVGTRVGGGLEGGLGRLVAVPSGSSTVLRPGEELVGTKCEVRARRAGTYGKYGAGSDRCPGSRFDVFPPSSFPGSSRFGARVTSPSGLGPVSQRPSVRWGQGRTFRYRVQGPSRSAHIRFGYENLRPFVIGHVRNTH